MPFYTSVLNSRVIAACTVTRRVDTTQEPPQQVPLPQEQPEKPRAARRKSSEWKIAEKELGELYETKVQLSGTEERGKITLEYYSKEQLYTLYDFLKRK